ncbi:metal transporter CNNM4-like [Spheniscus humboldti]
MRFLCHPRLSEHVTMPSVSPRRAGIKSGAAWQELGDDSAWPRGERRAVLGRTHVPTLPVTAERAGWAGITGGSAPRNRQAESRRASAQRGVGPSPGLGVRGVVNPIPPVPTEIRSPSHTRSASLSYHERSDSVSSPVSGSNNQLNAGTGAQYVADFSVRALTDLQFVKITRQEYQNGLTASRMDSCPQSPDSSAPKPDAGLPEKPEPSTTADETTSLLNERNCLSRRSNHSPLENSI